MTARQRPYRVALMVQYPSGMEDEIVLGAMDYADYEADWRLIGAGHRPFLPFDQIDLSAVDGVLGQITALGWAEALIRAGVAAVNTSTRLADLPLPRVGNDDVAIGRMGAYHLLERGFERFGFVGSAGTWYTQRRSEGFRAVVEGEAKLPCYEVALAADPATRQPAAREWIQGLPTPIAVMAANDGVALSLIEAAVALGRRIPSDVAVLGVDNDRWARALSPVPISSVAPDVRQIGYEAAQRLDQLMSGEASADVPPRWVPPVMVITRGSTDVVHQPDPAVRDALHFIRTRCGDGLGVGDVLDNLPVSRRTLENRLKRATGRTIMGEIQKAQVDKAAAMVANSRLSMGQIARACGFSRQEQFNRVFKRLTGLTPGEYRHRRER